MQIRCVSCQGMKQVMKLGLMYGDCDACNGTGKIHKDQCEKAEPIEADEELSPIEQYAETGKVPDKARRKPGPKPKVKSDE